MEIWFAKIERDVIARGVFTSVADLARKLRKYISAYATRNPFAGHILISVVESNLWLRNDRDGPLGGS